MKKGLISKFLLFSVLYIFFFVFCFFIFHGIYDDIWNYGFGYNIATGLVPYRDFNMLQTPLLFFIGSLFVIIFGHHLWCIYILNSLILTLIVYLIYKLIGKKTIITIPILLCCSCYNYNLLCLLFSLIILNIIDSDSKNKDIFVAFLVSLIFLSKQTIGMCMFIPMVYYSRNKIKSIISFMIPIFVFLYIYLLIMQCMILLIVVFWQCLILEKVIVLIIFCCNF